jgi:putative transcriptional regulator
MSRERPKRLRIAEQIRKVLEESIRNARGEIILKSTLVELPDSPPEIRAEDLIRLRLDSQMSQAVFARLLNVSTKTVQSWEQGHRKPSQAALRLIQVFRHDPGSLLRVAGMTSPQEIVIPREPESKAALKRRSPSSVATRKQSV